MKVRTGFRIPDSLNDFLARVAKERGITKNSLVIDIFWDYFEKRKNQVAKSK